MDSYTLGLLAGVAVGVAIVAVVKWRLRGRPMSVAEKAEFLSKRRARMLPALAVIFLAQQAAFFSSLGSNAPAAAQGVKLSAWLLLSIVLLAALSTKGFWLESREVRDLIDDENTRANRNDAMRWGFLWSMAAAIAVYALSMFDTQLNARDAVHIVLSIGIPAALIRWGMLERRALQDA
jgi:hypothetical protein